MSETPEEQCASLLKTFNEMATEKFMAGQEEHGGDIADRDCLKESMGEGVDLIFYLLIAEQQKREMKARLKALEGTITLLNNELDSAKELTRHYKDIISS